MLKCRMHIMEFCVAFFITNNDLARLQTAFLKKQIPHSKRLYRRCFVFVIMLNDKL